MPTLYTNLITRLLTTAQNLALDLALFISLTAINFVICALILAAGVLLTKLIRCAG